jgi:hypothetical protein
MNHSIIKVWITSAIFLGFSIVTSAQSNDLRVKKLNEYVQFTNEAIHGNLIVLRLLESFNRTLNKYVDQPSQQLNFYGNKDLPMDVYQDDNEEFYVISPNKWYAKLSTPSNVLNKAEQDTLLAIAKELKNITVQINQLRFEIETLLKDLDLRKFENQNLVYDKLEEGVQLYKDFHSFYLALKKEIANLTPSHDYTVYPETTKMLLIRLDEVYNQAHDILHKLYIKEDTEIASMIKSQQTAVDKLKETCSNRREIYKVSSSSRLGVYLGNILSKSQEAINDATAFTQSVPIPNEYMMYDKYYYYYNLSIINKFNKAGPGMVFDINQIRSLVSESLLFKFEMPHYFKVVYP